MCQILLLVHKLNNKAQRNQRVNNKLTLINGSSMKKYSIYPFPKIINK